VYPTVTRKEVKNLLRRHLFQHVVSIPRGDTADASPRPSELFMQVRVSQEALERVAIVIAIDWKSRP